VNDTCDLESALLLFLAVHDHIPCGNPTCCPPPKDQPVTNPYLIAKIAIGIYIVLVLAVVPVLLIFGGVFG
jgi:hypothetical protein